MLKKLKAFIFGKPPIEMDHEFIGRILFMGGDIPKEDDYWEAELENKEAKEPIWIHYSINVGLSLSQAFRDGRGSHLVENGEMI